MVCTAHQTLAPAKAGNGCIYHHTTLPLFYYAAENKTHTKNEIGCYHGYASTITKKPEYSVFVKPHVGGDFPATGQNGPDFSGFWGGLKYFWTLGNIDGYRYDRDGNVIGLSPVMGIAPSPGKVSGNVGNVAKQIQSWLGKDYKAIVNKAGDNIFMSKDGLLKMRFDIKNSHGDLPHIHLEKFVNGNWKDAIPGTHRIYPIF